MDDGAHDLELDRTRAGRENRIGRACRSGEEADSSAG